MDESAVQLLEHSYSRPIYGCPVAFTYVEELAESKGQHAPTILA